MGNESAVNLIDRILADANEAAAKVLAEAEASCNGIRESCEQEIAKRADRSEKERTQQVNAVLDGYKTRAELDGRKDALRDKRMILDEVFDEMYRNLLALPTDKREKLYLSILKSEAVAGDTVKPACCDRDVLKKTIAALPFPVKISDQDADTEAGFILFGSSYEKDCSMKAILRELRDAEETKIAKILFR